MTGHSEHTNTRRLRGLPAAMTLLAAMLLGACGGGAETQTNPAPGGGDDQADYQGPAAATEDVQAFRNSVWELVRPSTRCAQCHDAGGEASPAFADNTDVNEAWEAALSVVNLDSPEDSRMVTVFASRNSSKP